jgi:hypothetical protein
VLKEPHVSSTAIDVGSSKLDEELSLGFAILAEVLVELALSLNRRAIFSRAKDDHS